MGERALAAVLTSEGWYLFRSQHGAQALSDTSTYRGHPDAVRRIHTHDWKPQGYCPTERVFRSLDYLSLEAVYILTPSAVVVCIPLWFGLSVVEEFTAPTLGALALVGSPADRQEIEQSLTEQKRLLGDAVEATVLPRKEAHVLLLLGFEHRTIGLGSALASTLESLK